MRESHYNLNFSLGERQIIYNTLSGAIVETDEEGIKAIQQVKENLFDHKTVQNLKENGFWVDDEVDEKKIAQTFHEHCKYSGTRAYICTYVTFNCNLSCHYCFLEYFTGKPPLSMKSDTADVVAEFAKNVVLDNQCDELVTVFTGGEPLLNFSSVSVILKKLEEWSRINDIKYQGIIFSNGTALTKKMCEDLLNYNVFFQVTLAGAKDKHDKKRPYISGKGTYDDIIRGLKLLKNHKINFGLRIDVDKENLDSMEDMLENLADKVGTGFYIKFFPIISGAKITCSWTENCFRTDELGKLSGLWDLAKEKGFKVMLTPLLKRVYCEYQTNRGYIIDPDGCAYKCSGALGNKKCKIGDLDSKGKLTGLGYDYYNLMARNPFLIDECKDCKFLPACGGGCAGVANDLYDTYHRGDCREKYLIEERIKYYLKSQR